MRIAIRMILLCIVLMHVGCAGIRVSQDYDPGSDFSGLKSFSWKSQTQPETGDILVDSPLIDARIRRSIEIKLADMGYRLVSEGPHDFRVGYSYDVRTRFDSSPVSIGTGFGIGGGSSFGGIGIGIPAGGQSGDEALLVIDFFDSQTGKLLWRGTGTSLVKSGATPDEVTSEIANVVEKVLAQFPASRKI